MLCLGREQDQAVQIGAGPNKITVTVLQVKNGHVRLGFDAPREIPIVRTELLKYDLEEEVQKALDNGALDVLERVLEHRDQLKPENTVL
jgi:carbon storage regulator CsrA